MPPKKKSRVEGEDDKKLPAVSWQWCDGDDKTGKWVDFLDCDAAILEKEFAAKNYQFSTSAMSFCIGSTADYDLKKGTQTNQQTQKVRSIRRLTIGVWEYVDDHGMYIAYYDDDNSLVERLWRTMPTDGGVFVTTALSWNKGYDSKYTFTVSRDAVTGEVVGTQKNEDSGTVRKLRRTEPGKTTWDTAGYGIAGMKAPEAPAAAATPAVIAPPEAAPLVAATAAAVVPSAPMTITPVSMSIFTPPATWQPQTLPFEQFDVAEGSKEYNDVVGPFLTTLKNKAKIHFVKRLQNQPLWKFYALTRHKVALHNGGDPNEMNLFHGARVRENMNAIMEFGFDMRVARDGSAGVGIYFAVNASYSNGGYVLQNPDKSKEMFVCRVAVGSCVQGKHGMKRPPPKGKKNPEELHDSVHNGVNVMYIVFDNCQAYPEYLIKYTNLTGF